MVDLIIKARNQNYTLVVKYDEWDEFLIACKEKLLSCIYKSALPFKVFFHIHQQLTDTELTELIQLCQNCNTVFLGFTDAHLDENKEIQIIAHLYAGECVEYDEPVLIMGNVGKDVRIIAHESVIVNGIVQGSIDFMHEHCICTALGYQDARIRIYDTPFQNLTIFSYSVLYYEHQQRIIQKRGE